MRPSILVLVPFLAGACALPSLEVAPRYGQLSVSGSAGVESGGLGGSADLERAGLDDDGVLGLRADLKIGLPHLVVLGQQPNFTGRGQVDTTISDGTNTITANSDVDSKVELGMYDAALLFDLFPGDTIELAIGFGAAYLDVDMRFTDVGTSTTVSTQESLPVPMLAGMASVWIGPVEVSAFGGGVALDYNGDSLSFLDADLFARWKLFGGSELLRGSLVLGYRRTTLDLQYDDGDSRADVDLTIDGPYVGFEVSL